MERNSVNPKALTPIRARWLVASLWLLAAAPLMAWQETPDHTPGELSEAEKAIDEATQPFGPMDYSEEAGDERVLARDKADPDAEPEGDECDWELEGAAIQEQSQEVLRSVSCHTFRWFDSWWGDRYDYPEQAVNGWLSLGTSYRKFDGFDPRFRLRVRAPLPNLNNRWDLIIGRVDEEAYISDSQTQDETFYNPGAIDRGEDDSWLLGLGHRRRSQRKGWDWSVGVRLRLPPEPYAKVSWFYNTRTSENSDLRFRQTFFWRSNDGFGTTTRADYAWALTPRNVLRSEGVATLSESTEGARWYAGQTWFHLMKERRAFSLLAWARGETDGPVGVTDGGLNFVWREPFTRDWMFISYGPSITWPRRLPEDKRELNFGFGIWLEMEFGNWRY